MALNVESIDGLLHVAENVRILELSPTKRRLSLKILERLPHVQRLGVEGHWLGLNVLGDLPSLRSLTLSSVKVDSLDFVRGATGLAMLFLCLGKVDDISALASFPHLQELTVYRTKLGDLAPLSDCSQLAYLQLESLPAATLPDLSKLTQLKVLWLANLRDIDDLTPVAAAPNLRYLLIASKTLDPQAMAVLREHPTLEYLTSALGSNTRIAQAYEAAPYPDENDDNYQFRFRRELAKRVLAEPEAT